MKVAILGCGPAGLMAAAAVLKAEPYADIRILSNRRKSQLYGAQYLHAPIPGYTNETKRVTISYDTYGTPEDYRRKVYGPMWDGTVSPEDLAEVHYAWDLRDTYDRLWRTFSELVDEVAIDPAGMRFLTEGHTKWGKFDMIISSIPAPAICPEGHQFNAITIKAAGETPTRKLPYRNIPENTVICNGMRHPSYYRVSNIFGVKTVEWSTDINPPIPHAEVVKPLKTNCDCWPSVLRVGRYGEWRKGVLTHDAYDVVGSTLAAAT